MTCEKELCVNVLGEIMLSPAFTLNELCNNTKKKGCVLWTNIHELHSEFLVRWRFLFVVCCFEPQIQKKYTTKLFLIVCVCMGACKRIERQQNILHMVELVLPHTADVHKINIKNKNMCKTTTNHRVHQFKVDENEYKHSKLLYGHGTRCPYGTDRHQ